MSKRHFGPNDIRIFKAIMGSKAYGLDRPGSDEDILGIYMAPPSTFCGIWEPTKKDLTIDGHEPEDYCYHELSKYCHLALGGNPTVLELLWSDLIQVKTWEAELLIANRDMFLSQAIKYTFGNYAMDQAHKIKTAMEAAERGEKHDGFLRGSKHARHCFRLLQQGAYALEHGTIRVRVPNRDELFEISELPATECLKRFEDEYAAFQELPVNLPNRPDKERANEIVLRMRGLA